MLFLEKAARCMNNSNHQEKVFKTVAVYTVAVYTNTQIHKYHRTVAVYIATVLWYFEALVIGIILPQFEGRRLKHFLAPFSKNSISSFFLASDTRQL